MNIRKMCQVFFLEDGSALVMGVDFEASGGGLISKVGTRLSKDAIDSLLGVVVLTILEQTKVVEGATWDEKSALAAMCSLAGVKSDRALTRQSKELGVDLVGSEVQVTPTEFRLDHGGWHNALPQERGRCARDPEQVRNLILFKLEKCTANVRW